MLSIKPNVLILLSYSIESQAMQPTFILAFSFPYFFRLTLISLTSFSENFNSGFLQKFHLVDCTCLYTQVVLKNVILFLPYLTQDSVSFQIAISIGRIAFLSHSETPPVQEIFWISSILPFVYSTCFLHLSSGKYLFL